MHLAAHRAAQALVLVCSLAVAASARAEQPTPALVDLFTAIPQPPTSPQEAASWFDASGTLVHPSLVTLKQQIVRYRQGLDARQVDASAQAAMPPGLRTVAAFGARNVKAVDREPAAVREAVEAAQRAFIDQADRMGAHQALWQTNEAAIAKISTAPLDPGRPKPAQPIGEGCDAPCLAAWETYEAAVAAAQIARDSDVLALRRSAFAQARDDAAPFVREADTHLTATHYGELSSSQTSKSLIQTLDGAALGEVEDLVTRLEDIARTASITIRAQQAKTRAMSSRQ